MKATTIITSFILATSAFAEVKTDTITLAMRDGARSALPTPIPPTPVSRGVTTSRRRSITRV